MKTLVLTAKDILESLDRNALRIHMTEALRKLSAADAINFPRHVAEIESDKAVGFMLAQASVNELLGYKAVSVFLQNKKQGLNPHQGLVVLLNSFTGKVKSILDGSTITAVRTAAVSAAATDKLSRPDSRNLALVGAGCQAFEHALALAEVRPLQKIIVWSRSSSSAQKLVTELQSRLSCQFELAQTPQHAVATADIVVTCTSSKSPILRMEDFPEGVHINAIGACRPEQLEINLLDRQGLKIYLDSKKDCFLEASEIINAISTNELISSAIRGEIGECFSEKIPGRTHASDITFFKSVGLGIEDIFAADFFYKRSQEINIGISVDFEGAI